MKKTFRRCVQTMSSPIDAYDLRQLYDSLAAEWSHDSPLTHGDLIALPIVLEIVRPLADGACVLDLGCGDGFSTRLVSKWARRVVGVDYSHGMLMAAQAHQKSFANIQYVEADIVTLSDCLQIRDADLCLAINAACCIDRLDHLRSFHRSIHAMLRPGGTAIIQIPHPLDGQFNQPSEWLRDLDPLDSYFEGGQLVRRQLRTVNESWLTVARHHFSISDHFNAITGAGLTVQEMIEPAPTEVLLKMYPSLARDARLPSSLIFVAGKPAHLSALE